MLFFFVIFSFFPIRYFILGDDVTAWIWCALESLFLILFFVLVAVRNKKIVFDDKSLKVEKCGIEYDTDTKATSFELKWSDIDTVAYNTEEPYLITKQGKKYGLQTMPFYYGPFRWTSGYDRIEIWLRIDYYRKFYGDKQ